MDLRQYTVKEFAEMINEDTEIILNLMRDNDHLGYTNKPYEGTVMAVQRAEVRESNKELIAKYIYTNLFNRPEHRFYR